MNTTDLQLIKIRWVNAQQDNNKIVYNFLKATSHNYSTYINCEQSPKLIMPQVSVDICLLLPCAAQGSQLQTTLQYHCTTGPSSHLPAPPLALDLQSQTTYKSQILIVAL